MSPDDDAFRPPPEPGNGELKVDDAWEREREARKAAPVQSHAAKRIAAEAKPAPSKKSAAPMMFISLLIVALLGGAAFYVTQMRPPKPQAPIAPRAPVVVTPERPHARGPAESPRHSVDRSAPQPIPNRGISIRIVAAPGTPITIDGALAGKGTVSLKRSASTKAIEVGAPGVKRVIVPDRDQTVDLTKP